MSKLLQKYLKFWATGYLKRVVPEIIAITGSVGKTSTKTAIFEVLKVRYGEKVRQAEGNLNNETGVPAAILDFKKAPSYTATNAFSWLPIIIAAPFKSFFLRKVKILVLELAADKPGDIQYLTSFIKPKIAVLTGISPAHLEAFSSMRNIIEEKTDLLRALPTDGTAIINLDDDNARKVSYGGRYNKLTYGIVNKADFEGSAIKTEIKDYSPHTTFQISHQQDIINIVQETLGEKGNVLASLAGAACGELYNLKNVDIKKGLENVQAEKHRLNVLRGKNDTVIIDDCYNASPVSMKAALELLKKLPGGRKIAVLGDMRELGKIATESHKLIGEYAKNVADMVIAIGNLAKNYGSNNYFRNPHKAADFLLNKVHSGDIILIKASRAIGLEKIVDAIKAE